MQIDLVLERLKMIGIASFFALFAFFIAWRSHYFSLPDQKKIKPLLSLGLVAGAFAIYFLIEMSFIPLVVGAWFYFTQGVLPSQLESVLDESLKGWLNLVVILFAASALIFYCCFLGKPYWNLIWSRREKINIRLKNLMLGMLTWFLSYPIVVIISQVFAVLLLLLFPESKETYEQIPVVYLKNLIDYPWLFFCSAIAIIFIVPIAEEVLFRGFLQTWLMQVLGRLWAIVITSIIFSLFHFSFDQGLSNWELLSALFVLSCFLGFIYERQRSLWAPIGLHASFNAISIFMIVLKYFNETPAIP